MDPLRRYYDARAPEYEAIYGRDDPARQREQEELAQAMCEALAGRRVLDVACGAAYWTARLADMATHVVAVDASPAMLELARAKELPTDKVDFVLGDACRLPCGTATFDGAVANFWLSHVPRDRLTAFLRHLHERLTPGAVVFMADNVLVPGVGGDLVSRSGTADTFKRRRLTDGSAHEVLKNYYNEDELRRLFAPRAERTIVHVGRCFWWANYEIPLA